MAYEVRIEQHAAQPLAVVRRLASRATLGKVVQDGCGLVWNVLRAAQVVGAGRHVAIYYDCEINLEVGAEVPTPFAGQGQVIGSSTPAGLVATTTHFGPYGQMHAAHQAIRQFCASQGYSLAGPNWEVYGHWQDAWNSDPSQIRTDVFYLLAGPSATA